MSEAMTPAGRGSVTTASFEAVEPSIVEPEWLAGARERCAETGQYVAYMDGDEIVVAAVTQEWTRVGRSLAADIRFDDPTVSRRHALIVRGADGVRVLDDRSLNGVFVNGERVEWSTLRDGDEILVGRHELRFMDVSAVPQALASAQAAPS
jgi:hypothetical protein